MTEKQGGSDVRANITRAESAGDGWWELHGHKWFCSYPPCDVFLVLAQTPGRPLLLPARARAGDGVPASQGQARHPLAAVVARSSSSGAAARMLGRGGPRRGDDHRDGHAHPPGLRDRLRGRHPPRGRRGGLARAPPQRVRRAAVRAAADAQRARRPRARVRGRDRDRAAARPLLRRGRRDVPALRHGGPEVLGLQARHRARGRVARVPRRQRLRRGVADAAAAARLAAERHLGGLGQRDEPRRAARDGARARRAARVPGRVRAGPRRRRAARRAPRLAARDAAALAGEDAQWLARRAVEDLALAFQAVAARAHGAARGGRRVLRGAPRRRPRARLRHAAGGRRRRRRSLARALALYTAETVVPRP